MKAAVLHGYDEKLTGKEFVKYEDVADPKINEPSDVIVRIGGAGVCRTDLHIVEGIWRSKVEVNLPYIMGHENAGWVEEIGKGVQGVKVNLPKSGGPSKMDGPKMQAITVDNSGNIKLGGEVTNLSDLETKLNAVINRELAAPEMQRTIANMGAERGTGAPKDFADFIAAERMKWDAVVKAAGIRID